MIHINEYCIKYILLLNINKPTRRRQAIETYRNYGFQLTLTYIATIRNVSLNSIKCSINYCIQTYNINTRLSFPPKCPPRRRD